MRNLLDQFKAAETPDEIKGAGQALLAGIRTNAMLRDEDEALRILLRQSDQALLTMKNSDPMQTIIAKIGSELTKVGILPPIQADSNNQSLSDSSVSLA
ncbi:MAG: hypothetical protein ABL890_04180 [Candidatus Peribacteraceae bacterium]